MGHKTYRVRFIVKGKTVIEHFVPRALSYHTYLDEEFGEYSIQSNRISEFTTCFETFTVIKSSKSMIFRKEEIRTMYLSCYSGITVIKDILEPFEHSVKIKVGWEYEMDRLDFHISEDMYNYYLNQLMDN